MSSDLGQTYFGLGLPVANWGLWGHRGSLLDETAVLHGQLARQVLGNDGSCLLGPSHGGADHLVPLDVQAGQPAASQVRLQLACRLDHYSS